MNALNLFFGPKLPVELDLVGLTFIAAPMLHPDSAVASLSAERYAKENYPHIDYNWELIQDIQIGSTIDLSLFIPAVKNSLFTTDDTANYSSVGNISVTVGDTFWSPKILNNPIKVLGINITPANTWQPIIKPGTVWRKYTVPSTEPTDSWLRASGLVEEDTVILIYTVPETRYNTTTGTHPDYPSTVQYKTVKELPAITSPNTLKYTQNLEILTEVRVNGTLPYTDTLYFTGTETHSLIKSIDKISKTITLTKSLGPDEYVEITYLAYNDYYNYSGFRDKNGQWYAFDSNPEYGHLITDDSTHQLRPASDVLLEQITIYALPSAYLKVEQDPFTDGRYVMTFVRAINYDETHFVRHLISGERTENIGSRFGGSTASTWGYAISGRNYYDEVGTFYSDIFSEEIPSMLPLGKFVLAAPASINSTSIADIRNRGGGIPEDYSYTAIDTNTDGIDTLKGFWDQGIWEGEVVKEGGVVEVKIDPSLLKSDEDDPDPTTFTYSQIYEIVKSQMPPGIEFEIIFDTV